MLSRLRAINSSPESRMFRANRLVVTVVSVFSLVAVAGFAGCAALPDDEPGAPAAADEADADTVYRTIVRLAPDGSIEQSFEVIRPEQQQAEQAARAALVEASRTGGVHASTLPTLGVERVCSGNSLWLFDKINRTGNQLCLIKASADDMAWLDLGTICRGPTCLLTWNNAVRSLWAGVDPGSLQSCTSTLCFATPFLNFGVLQQINNIAAGAPHPLNWAFLFTP